MSAAQQTTEQLMAILASQQEMLKVMTEKMVSLEARVASKETADPVVKAVEEKKVAVVEVDVCVATITSTKSAKCGQACGKKAKFFLTADRTTTLCKMHANSMAYSNQAHEEITTVPKKTGSAYDVFIAGLWAEYKESLSEDEKPMNYFTWKKETGNPAWESHKGTEVPSGPVITGFCMAKTGVKSKSKGGRCGNNAKKLAADGKHLVCGLSYHQNPKNGWAAHPDVEPVADVVESTEEVTKGKAKVSPAPVKESEEDVIVSDDEIVIESDEIVIESDEED